MTKMDMVWVAVASLLQPRTDANVFVQKAPIDSAVLELFGETITPVMINKHLVNSEDRQADRANPNRGGSRNRYLVSGVDGNFRLYKRRDGETDAGDKTGPTHPSPGKLDPEYRHLVAWYEGEYLNTYGPRPQHPDKSTDVLSQFSRNNNPFLPRKFWQQPLGCDVMRPTPQA